MSSAAFAISFRQSVLPWALSPQDEARFKRIRNRVLTVSALLCLLFLWLDRPQEDRTQVAELPPQLAKIVLEREAPPPPAPPPAKVEKKAEEQVANAHPKKPDDPKPETVKNPVPEARKPLPNKPPGEIEGARRKAAGVGLLAMKDQLAEIRGAPVAVQLNQDIKPGAGVGAGKGPGVGAGDEQGIPVRALITSNATNGSGGINTAAFSRNTGGGGLAGRATTLVEGVAANNDQAGRRLKFLRRVPVDPMTRTTDWALRSYQDLPNSTRWGGENVFDVHTSFQGTALDGSRYTDW